MFYSVVDFVLNASSKLG